MRLIEPVVILWPVVELVDLIERVFIQCPVAELVDLIERVVILGSGCESRAPA